MTLSKENIKLVNLILLQQCFGAGSIKATRIFNCLNDNQRLNYLFSKDNLSDLIDKKDVDKILQDTLPAGSIAVYSTVKE